MRCGITIISQLHVSLTLSTKKMLDEPAKKNKRSVFSMFKKISNTNQRSSTDFTPLLKNTTGSFKVKKVNRTRLHLQTEEQVLSLLSAHFHCFSKNFDVERASSIHQTWTPMRTLEKSGPDIGFLEKPEPKHRTTVKQKMKIM